jgi:hypothetical protein
MYIHICVWTHTYTYIPDDMLGRSWM